MGSMARPRFLSDRVKRWCWCFMLVVAGITGFCEAVDAEEPTPTISTNPSDLQALHELMYSISDEEDWRVLFPDPCVSGPQGIFCEPDPSTGVLFVTTLQFGFLSAIANIIRCSSNATIPASIASFTRLTTLSFTSCFKGQAIPFPPSLPASLRMLTMTSNPALVGAIPPSLGSLPSLQRLVLSQNGLQGPIPAELSALRSLVQLDLSHNQLSGAIPDALGAIDALVNLDLRWNDLQGALPKSMTQGLNQLQRLALSNNRITSLLLLDSPSSSSFTGLQALTFLDVSVNDLRGALPSSLGSLQRLEDLFLNSNRGLNGSIPTSIANLASLVRLDLSNCALEGAIPEDLGVGLRDLRFLSVRGNKLSGRIPASLASLPVIFTLNLDGNQLTGPLPFSATFVQKMGRNLVVKPANPGLCSFARPAHVMQLGVEPCPENETAAATTGSAAAKAPAPAIPSGSFASNKLHNAVMGGFVVTLVNCWLMIM